jgi:hypothetical protein
MRSVSALVALPFGLAVVLNLGACTKELKFTSIDPNFGTSGGGEEVVLEGANFPKGGVKVAFGFKEAQPVVMESTSKIRVMTPVGDKNVNTDVTITFDDGRTLVLKNGFRYVDTTRGQEMRDKALDRVVK